MSASLTPRAYIFFLRELSLKILQAHRTLTDKKRLLPPSAPKGTRTAKANGLSDYGELPFIHPIQDPLDYQRFDDGTCGRKQQ